MRKFIDKYFNWLGIKNEGFRRILCLVIFSSIIGYFLMLYDIWSFLYDDFWEVTGAYFLIFIGFSITIKVISWIKDGFKGEIID